jgi:hypothetical protein
MTTNREKEWPDLIRKWCQDEIKQIDRELADGPAPARKEELEQRRAIIDRVRREYEAE